MALLTQAAPLGFIIILTITSTVISATRLESNGIPMKNRIVCRTGIICDGRTEFCDSTIPSLTKCDLCEKPCNPDTGSTAQCQQDCKLYLEHYDEQSRENKVKQFVADEIGQLEERLEKKWTEEHDEQYRQWKSSSNTLLYVALGGFVLVILLMIAVAIIIVCVAKGEHFQYTLVTHPSPNGEPSTPSSGVGPSLNDSQELTRIDVEDSGRGPYGHPTNNTASGNTGNSDNQSVTVGDEERTTEN